MALWKDFKSFAFKGNVVDLAVAVVIGKAFGDIVTAVVQALIMPIVAVVLPGGNWREYKATPLHLEVGKVLGATIDFFFIAFLMFLVVNRVMKTLIRDEAPAPPNTKKCGECLEDIPREAKRCRACTSPC